MMPLIQNSVACGADSNENVGWINDFISVCIEQVCAKLSLISVHDRITSNIQSKFIQDCSVYFDIIFQ